MGLQVPIPQAPPGLVPALVPSNPWSNSSECGPLTRASEAGAKHTKGAADASREGRCRSSRAVGLG